MCQTFPLNLSHLISQQLCKEGEIFQLHIIPQTWHNYVPSTFFRDEPKVTEPGSYTAWKRIQSF